MPYKMTFALKPNSHCQTSRQFCCIESRGLNWALLDEHQSGSASVIETTVISDRDRSDPLVPFDQI